MTRMVHSGGFIKEQKSAARGEMMESESAFARRWRMRRSLYRWGIFAWFVILAFIVGPKVFLWMWGVKPAPTTPDYFIPTVKRYCEPVVRGMKEYEKIHGHRPNNFADFALGWQTTEEGQAMINGGDYSYVAEFNHVIQYDFTPGHERWTVKGPFVNGVIPLPPVKIDGSAASTSNRVAK